jgi:cobalamin-dependent methionine synthase I
MIGGATTSPAHTAVKIEPAYNKAPIIHATDASRAVGIVSRLLSKEERQPLWDEVSARYAKIRETRARTQGSRERVSLDAARANGFDADAGGYQPVAPQKAGLTTIDDVRLADLVPISTGRRSFSPGSSRAAIRPFWMIPTAARRRATCSRMRRPCSRPWSRKTG